MAGYDAVVLAGGRSRRFGGADKTQAVVSGRPLLDHVLDAVADAGARVVVGDPRPTALPVVWIREDPAYAGPVHALATGLTLTTADVVVVLAGDVPLVDRPTVRALRDAVPEANGAILVDGEGHDQPLVSAWSRPALLRALATLPATANAAMRDLLPALRPTRVAARDMRPVWLDVDTPEDVEGLHEWLTYKGGRR